MTMDENHEEVKIPVTREELHAETVPVVTGGIRVTKSVQTHDEIVEQELRKSHANVKRIKTDRIVDGPQSPHREGNTLIVPVVSQVLRIEKQWVVTEEIHITEIEEREAVRQRVPVNREEARVERLDSTGNRVSPVPVDVPEENCRDTRAAEPTRPASLVARADQSDATLRKPLSRPRSILKNRPRSK